MSAVRPELVERLRELALVEIDTLLHRLPDEEALALVGAFVGDLEDALAEARAALRDAHRALGVGADPLGLVDLGAGRRARAGDGAITESAARLAQRAAERRELALLEEAVQGVLPRLLEADRRYVAMGGK
jgi:hypothetical protein